MNPQADALAWKPGPSFTPGGPSPAPTPESPGPVPLHEAPAWRPRPETPQSGIHPSESRPGIHSGKPRPGECHSSKLQVCASLKPGPSATTRSHDPALSPGSRRSASASPQLRWVVSPRGLGPVRLRGIAIGPLPARPQPMPASRKPGHPGPSQAPPRQAPASARPAEPGRPRAPGPPGTAANPNWRRVRPRNQRTVAPPGSHVPERPFRSAVHAGRE